MAELVQLRLEETVDELEQMVRVGLFSLKEVKFITKKRKHLEYKIHRLAKTKQDFLKYIEYEINVLELIRKRRKEIGYMHKKDEIDQAITNRINRLFMFVEHRHQHDVEVWLNHIRFCKKVKWRTSISRIFIRLLQVHSNKAELWIAAANWEIEENNSIDTARKLLLRGLRFLPDSKSLYQHCFRLELQHVDKILQRRKILGVVDQNEEVSDKVLKGAVAMAIYKDAVSKIKDAEFNTSFVAICEEFDFTKEIQEKIVDDIRLRFCTTQRLPNEEHVWDFCAKRLLTKAIRESMDLEEAVQMCLNAYDFAIDTVSSVEMYTRCIEMCLSKREDPLFTSLADVFENHVTKAFESGDKKNLLSEEMYMKWISLVEDEEKKTILEFGLDKYPQSESLWLMRIKYEISNGTSEKCIQKIFNRATEKVPVNNSLIIWHLAIEWVLATNSSKAVGLLKKTLSIPSRSVAREVKLLYLEVVVLNLGIEKAREVYKTIRWNPPIIESFFWKMFEYEYAQPKHVIKDLRKILEDIISQFGKSSIDVWLRYIKLENEHKDGNAESVSKIHWRAMKNLEPEFETKYLSALTLIHTGIISE